jgi:uncharacterized protein
VRVPSFPEWTPVYRDVREDIERLTEGTKLSDYNYISLTCWDISHEARVSNLNDNLILRYPDYITGQHNYSFIGKNRLQDTVSQLLKIAGHDTNDKRIQLVPEQEARLLARKSKFKVVEDRDNHDYVISMPAVAKRSGKAFLHVRSAFNKFVNQHGHGAEFSELDLKLPDVQWAILNVFLTREKGKPNSNYSNEFYAVTRLLREVYEHPLRGFGIERKGKLIGFIIVEELDHVWCLGHFWKADVNYYGIYSYLMCRVAEILSLEGFRYMNIEQDLGIEGLRQAKRFLNPVTLLKKFTILDSAETS